MGIKKSFQQINSRSNGVINRTYSFIISIIRSLLSGSIADKSTPEFVGLPHPGHRLLHYYQRAKDLRVDFSGNQGKFHNLSAK